MSALISSADGFDAAKLTAYGTNVTGAPQEIATAPSASRHATTLAYDGIRHGLRLKTPAFPPRALTLSARAPSASMRARVSLDPPLAAGDFRGLLAAIADRVGDLTKTSYDQNAHATKFLDFLVDEEIAVFDADTRSALSYADAGDLARMLKERPVAWLLELHGVLVQTESVLASPLPTFGDSIRQSAFDPVSSFKLAWRATQALVFPVLDTNPWGSDYPFIDDDDAGSLCDYDFDYSVDM
jgi:hypothetical protein